ncbi:muscarinic acetylcholine receptor M1-like [Dermacentor andersoni]|uniref:muscarinic acetylcholine receptor M1-like n=1 Tax=Dermacentor andersoni TaxID=34620 RepID=UPI00215521FD|nr:muscarinic acetylcholine receptor DM1-like [Dermacentor andersoni]
MSVLEEAFNASMLLVSTEVPGSGTTFDDAISGNGSVANGSTNATNYSGVTTDGYPATPYSLAEIVVLASLSTLAAVLTIIGNLMVMVSFNMDKQLRTISNYFLLSLAVADFSIGVISMPLMTMYILYAYWPIGAVACDTWLAFDYMNSNASVLNLLVICFDRYFSVTRPLTYRANRTPQKAAIMIALAWIISFLLWPPWVFAWPYIEGQRTVPEEHCYIQFLETNVYITFGTAIAAFYLPVSVMCALYWRIWRETEKRKKGLGKLQEDRRKGGSTRKSTSSNGTLDSEDFRSSDSCKSRTKTSQLTSSLSLTTSLPEESKTRQLRDFLMSLLRVKNGKRCDDDASYSGSPGTHTPPSVETSVESVSTSFHEEHQVEFNPSGRDGGGDDSGVSSIPTSDRGGLPCHGKAEDATDVLPAMSQSSDSVYTIPIEPETQPSLQEESSQACAKTNVEEDTEKPEPDRIQSSENAAAPEGSATAKEVADTGVESIRKPLTTSAVQRQPAVAKQLPVTSRKKAKQQDKKQDQKAAKTLSAILLAFIITWTPYNVLVLVKTVTSGDDVIPVHLWNFAYYFCYINSTVNPLCYALCNVNFRQTYIRILTCKWRNRRRVAARLHFS